MKNLLKYQGYHILIYLIFGLAIFLYTKQNDLLSNKTFLNVDCNKWLIITWVLAGIHQAWVLLFYRLEYYYGKVSAFFGKSGFAIYSIGFGVFGVSRFLTIIPISMLSNSTLNIKELYADILMLFLLPFILWGLYSVKVYFGLKRALGIDHFDASYRGGALEKRGIFKYIPNSMYVVVLLLLYFPGLWHLSELGLLVGLGHHLFVWTHYFCTEKPDMKAIYG